MTGIQGPNKRAGIAETGVVGDVGRRVRRLVLGFAVVVPCIISVLALQSTFAEEFPTEPQAVIETGMHVGSIRRIDVDQAERFVVPVPTTKQSGFGIWKRGSCFARYECRSRLALQERFIRWPYRLTDG